jgi:hypothetical protein
VKFEIPKPLKSEHEELHTTLVRATKEAGALGAAARAVAKLMDPHFAKEEQFALPPIALLPRLARGDVTSDLEEILVLSDRLQHELAGMLNDHKEIVNALKGLLATAREEDRVEYVEFARQLIRHAQMEELVMYPAAILAGRYIRLKLGISER